MTDAMIDINALLAAPQHKATSARGAAMGRPDEVGEPAPLRLQKLRFEDGCYDTGGAYWGAPDNLWCAWSDDCETMIFVRAGSRTAALAAVVDVLDERTGETPDAIATLWPVADELPLEQFLDAYITAALWSSTISDDSHRPELDEEEHGEFFDAEYTRDDLAPETLAAMRDDCRRFLTAHAALIRDEHMVRGKADAVEQAGHDFWLTRCGHGSGFADGDWADDVAATLDAAAEAFGNVDLWAADGKVYQE